VRGGEDVAKLEDEQAVRLARTLRKLRESHWPDVELTQVQLAEALSKERKVGPATISSWESTRTRTAFSVCLKSRPNRCNAQLAADGTLGRRRTRF